MSRYLEYAKAFNANDEVQFWITHNLQNYLKTNPEVQDDIEHIIDYLTSDSAPKRLKSMSYDEAKNSADKWTKSQQKKGQHIKETAADTEVVLDFKDGFKIVKLIGEKAYKREGYLMSHCVGGYYGNGKEIYSLRDKDNVPHCTMEKDQQVKGKGNGNIHPKYVEYVVKFLEYVGMTVGDSEMRHLGYTNMEKFKKELSKDTKFINKVYLPDDEKLIGTDGEEYASLDLWNVRPLLTKTEDTVKINFELPTFIKLSFERIRKQTKVSKKSSATAGDDAHSATAGDGAHSATAGYGAHSATAGDGAHSATAGYGAHSATAGYDAHSATAGDDAHSATAGDGAHSATAGDRANSATAGYGAHSATAGDDAIACSVGRKASAKGSLGCWLVLAEWYEGKEFTDAKPIAIESVKIDGKKIKADTWYVLIDGKFVEVNHD